MLAILFYTQIKLKLECTSCGSWTLNQMHPEANLGVGVFWSRESWCQGSTSAAASRTSAAVSRTSAAASRTSAAASRTSAAASRTSAAASRTSAAASRTSAAASRTSAAASRTSAAVSRTSAAVSRTSAAVSRTSLDLSDKVRIIKTDKDYILVELENSDEELVAGGRRVWVKRDTFFRVECVL